MTHSPSPSTSGKAIASLVLGLLSLFCVPLIPAVIGLFLGMKSLKEIRASNGMIGGRGMAIAGLVTSSVGSILGACLLVVLPLAIWFGPVATQKQTVNNLRQIGLAMHNHQSTHGVLPASQRSYYNQGVDVSWRVNLLPYIEYDKMWREYDQKVAWDTPRNNALLDRMPPTYAHPGQGTDGRSRMTHYQVFVGPHAAFEKQRGISLVQFTDGTSNTILAVEARDAVPWTKPQDLDYATDQPLPKLGLTSGGFNAVFADGSVRFIPASIDDNVLRALITRDGDEKVTPP